MLLVTQSHPLPSPLHSLSPPCQLHTSHTVTSTPVTLSPPHQSHCHLHTSHTVTSTPVTLSPPHQSHCHLHTSHTVTSTPVTLSPPHQSHCHLHTSHTVTSTPVTPSPVPAWCPGQLFLGGGYDGENMVPMVGMGRLQWWAWEG